MMEPLASLEPGRPVLLLKMLSNGALAALDADPTLYFIHPQTLKIIGSCRAAIPQENFFGNHVDISPYGQVFAAIVPKSNKVALYGVRKKRILHEIGRHHGQVESVAIDPKTRYIVTGGEDGKLFAWDIKSGALAFTLPSHTDHVTAIAFSEDAGLIATGSYNKLIHLMAFEGAKRPRKLYGHGSAVAKLLFAGKNRLLSAGRGGELLVWDLRRGKIAKRLESVHGEITALCLCDEKRYLFVGAKGGAVHLYDLHDNTLLSKCYVQMKSTVSALAYIGDGKRLAVGTVTGRIDIYSLVGDEAALKRLADAGEYPVLYDAAEANVMLRSCEVYMDAEKMWDAAVHQAKRMLESGNVAAAKAALHNFSDVKSKKGIISELLRNSEEFIVFKENADGGRYVFAYAAAARYPEFRKSAPYRKMEERWQKALLLARKLAGDKKGEEEARAVLSPYRGISEKTAAIQQILHEGRHHAYFKELIDKREWKKVFELVKLHTFLKDTRDYLRLMNYADKLFIDASKAYAKGDFAMTRKLCEILSSFPDFKRDAMEMLNDLHKKG